MAEHNLIQAPEIVGRLFRRLGIRQAHVAPTLNDGVQAVVILDDARSAGTDLESARAIRYSILAGAVPDAINVFSIQVYNPFPNEAGTGIWIGNADGRQVQLRIRRMVIDNQKVGASVGDGVLWGVRQGPVTGVGGSNLLAMRSLQQYADAAPAFAHAIGISTVNGIGATPGPQVSHGRCQVALDSTVIIDWPNRDEAPIIPPGWSWVVKQNTTNGDIDVTVEWDEEVIVAQR